MIRRLPVSITSSYQVQIIDTSNLFRPTLRIYREAVSFLIKIYHQEWDFLSGIEKPKARFNAAEHLVHSTKANKAKYDFDNQFYKMPSYLRRAATQDALGCVSSYISNLKNRETHGKKGKPPKLQSNRFVTPTFYKAGMYLPGEEANTAHIKLFVRNDWVWVKVKLRSTDVKYLQRYWSHCTPSAPTLEKRYGKYYLRFAFTESVKLNTSKPLDQRICAVDLGINSDAVCSIMDVTGTVLARKFINFPGEKDRLCRVLNRIKKFQRKNGSQNTQSFWAYARRLNDELSKKIAASIVEYAALQKADCLVFEYLSFRGQKVHGSKAQRLSLWRKNGIQDYAEHKAHRCGIRVSHVCAWGTSRLAYDGSGTVQRNEKNHALAVFQTGKQYNCDLSASYNIGARYFIRELLKPLPEKVRSALSANVPEVQRRTLCTLNTLLQLNAALAA